MSPTALRMPLAIIGWWTSHRKRGNNGVELLLTNGDVLWGDVAGDAERLTLRAGPLGEFTVASDRVRELAPAPGHPERARPSDGSLSATERS